MFLASEVHISCALLTEQQVSAAIIVNDSSMCIYVSYTYTCFMIVRLVIPLHVMLAEFKLESFIGAAPWLLSGPRGLDGNALPMGWRY